MLNSKKVLKQNILRAFKVLTAFLLVFLTCGILQFFLSPVSYAHWAIHDRKELSGTIDTVIIGDSLPMYAVQPSVVDEKLGCTSFNASSASQHLDETYYLLLDYLKTENIKDVYFGLDYYNFLKVAEEGSPVSQQQVYKRLTDIRVKFEFLKNYFNFDNAFDWLFPVRLNRDRFLDIPTNIKAKLTYEYRNYLPLSDERYLLEAGTYYYDKGYVFTDRCSDSYVEGKVDLAEMSDKNIEWFEKIISLCKDNNVNIHIFHTPVKYSRLKVIKNYELFDNKVHEIADKYDIDYLDFNYYKSRSILNDDIDFVNAAHLNNKGSNIFMEWFCNEYK